MQQEQFKSSRYPTSRLQSRLSSLRRKNRQKVSFVCDISSRNHSLRSNQCDNSKLRLKHEISKSFCLQKKLVTEPEQVQMFRFPENSDGSNDEQEEADLLPKLPLLQRKTSRDKVSNNNPNSKIVPKLPFKADPLPEKLFSSVQRSQNSNKSKSRSIKHLPRVIDVFELYDRKRKRKEVANNMSNILQISFEKKQERKEFAQQVLLSPVITIEDFDLEKELEEKPKANNIKESLKKHLAAVNKNVSRLEIFNKPQNHTIPFLPLGKNVVFLIYENWGDPEYIGLNGVEFFNELGDPITPLKLNSQPCSVQSGNPHEHSLKNLRDGSYYGTSPYHSFLSPFDSKSISIINFSFEEFVRLSMIRIWNYNATGRSQCGIKTIEIKLDGTCIFAGNIRKAQGKLKDYWKTCEYIVLTDDQLIIEKISAKDWLNKMDFSEFQNIHQDSLFSTNAGEQTGHSLRVSSTIEIEVMENYGNRDAFKLNKIALYDSNGTEVKFSIRQGQAKEYPIFLKGLNLDMIERKSVDHIVVKNVSDDRAIRRIRIKFDGKKCYQMRLKRTKQDQHMYVSTHMRYGWSILKHANFVPCGKDIKLVLFPSFRSAAIGINKLELYDINGCPIFRSRQFGYTSSVNFSYDCGQLENNLQDYISAANPLTINIHFEDIVFLGALCLWNCMSEPFLGVSELHFLLNNRILWSGSIRQYRQSQPLTAIFLTHCPVLQNKLNQFTVEQDKFTRQMWYINEGRVQSARAGPSL